MDALRADAGQRRQLARRVKQLSSADSSKLAQQLLKQENAVRDAAPARRDALRRERAQQREQARADVAARLRATVDGRALQSYATRRQVPHPRECW